MTVYVNWHTSDSLLNDALSRHYNNGFTESKYGLMIFRRMSWLSDSADSRQDVIYGHIVRQLEEYQDVKIKALCGVLMSLYSVSDMYPLVNISQVSEEGMCKECSLKAERTYWIKNSSLV